MKKKLSRILAAALALALAFSMTVFAAESPVTTEFRFTEATADQWSAAKAEIDKISKVFEGRLYDVVDYGVEDLGYYVNGVQTPYDDEVTVTYYGLKANTPYLVLHQKHDGTWESFFRISNANGEIVVTLSGCSTIAVVELAENTGNGGSSDAAPVNNSASASPKTGEALPVAGIAMLICLAGVVVCGKKYSVNR